MQSQIIAKVAECVAQIKTRWGVEMPMPTIRFDIRGGTIAGRAHYLQHKVDFNAAIARENLEKFLHTTVPHEVAHLAAFRINGGHRGLQPHGDLWQRVMESLGAAPNRCHTYQVSHLKIDKRPYLYKCSCKTHAVGGKVHKNMSNGGNYKCRLCRQSIVFIGRK